MAPHVILVEDDVALRYSYLKIREAAKLPDYLSHVPLDTRVLVKPISEGKLRATIASVLGPLNPNTSANSEPD